MEKEAPESIPRLINQFSLAVELLYKQEARVFWIHNTGPIGCLPELIFQFPPKPDNADEIGCIKSFNKVAQEFNNQLKASVYRLRDRLQDATIIYVDIYSAKYTLLSNAKDYGFLDPLGYCCGEAVIFNCWEKRWVNGTEVHPDACSNPSEYISWDGTHYSEAANKWLSEHILDGSFSEPQVPINGACHKPFVFRIMNVTSN